MTKKEIEKRCGAVCPSAAQSKCAFSRGEIIGFIDTSARMDGSRGIAFSAEGMAVNTDGTVRRIAYKNIRSVSVVESFESRFADELIVSGASADIRISDYSLDKTELKSLIDGLRGVGLQDAENVTADEAHESVRSDLQSGLQDERKTQEIRRENIDEPKEALDEETNEEHDEEINEQADDNSPQEQDIDVFEVTPENDVTAVFQNEQVFSGVIPEEAPPAILEEFNEQARDNSPDEINNDVFAVIPENDFTAVFQNEQVFSGVIPEEAPSAIPEEFSEQAAEEPSRETDIFASAPANDLQNEFINNFTDFPNDDFPNEQEFPSVIPEEARENAVVSAFAEEAAVLSAVEVLPTEVLEKETFTFKIVSDSEEFTDDDFDEQAELERIGAMSHEQTISYLANAFAEINATAAKEASAENTAVPPKELSAENTTVPEKEAKRETEEIPPAVKNPENTSVKQRSYEVREVLTVEPVWGDIYIKASRSLRELCEQGRLSMDAIREELSERLLPSAQAFASITADESKIPKVLMPMITELRNAANNFDEYFSYGEDIGTRAMFFMLFQMLSYADRIVEDPEVKKRHNDFFRRFGSAGIILSMLDKRV